VGAADEGGKQAWGDDIPPERQAELERRLQAWEQEADHGNRKGPFDVGDELSRFGLTGADVFWLAGRTLAATGEPEAVAEQIGWLRQAQDNMPSWFALDLGSLHLEGANLGWAHLEGAYLSGVHLEGANLGGVIEGMGLFAPIVGAPHAERAILRGAYLTGSNLAGVHLEAADLRGAYIESSSLTEAYLTRADLREAHLEGATLHAAHLEHANLSLAHLEHADLGFANLERADLTGAYLASADLIGAHLERAFFTMAHLEGARLGDAHLEGARLGDAHLEGARLGDAHLEGARLGDAHLEGAYLLRALLDRANLCKAHLEGTDLRETHLEGADVSEAHLAGADLTGAHLERANLRGSLLARGTYRPDDEEDFQRVKQWVPEFPRVLAPADLRGTFMDSATAINDVSLGMPDGRSGQGYVRVADVRWGGVNLAVVKDWPPKMVLGDEREAWAWQPPKRASAVLPTKAGKKLSREERAEARRQQAKEWQDKVATAEQERLELFRAAVRANRQLATALREQGMNEEADRFFYRAQVCQRQVFRLRHQWARQFFSWLLDVVSGHGYQPGKTLGWYLAVIVTFAGAYLAASYDILTFGLPPSSFSKLAWYEALVLSVSSFHGRGFLPFPNLGDPITILAAIEAVFGLFIEVSFIATFTQRYFGK
jgi:uncharacterized protein YjbI with pentapeptide repeats